MENTFNKKKSYYNVSSKPLFEKKTDIGLLFIGLYHLHGFQNYETTCVQSIYTLLYLIVPDFLKCSNVSNSSK